MIKAFVAAPSARIPYNQCRPIVVCPPLGYEPRYRPRQATTATQTVTPG